MTIDDALDELSGRFESVFGTGLKKCYEARINGLHEACSESTTAAKKIMNKHTKNSVKRTTDCGIEYKGGVVYEKSTAENHLLYFNSRS